MFPFKERCLLFAVKFKVFLMFVLVYVSVCKCMPHVSRYLCRPEEGVVPRARVTSSCELAYVGAGNRIHAL